MYAAISDVSKRQIEDKDASLKKVAHQVEDSLVIGDDPLYKYVDDENIYILARIRPG